MVTCASIISSVSPEFILFLLLRAKLFIFVVNISILKLWGDAEVMIVQFAVDCTNVELDE